MQCYKVSAIIRSSHVEPVERKLSSMKVPGITVYPVRGFGEHRNLFSENRMVDRMRVEVFCNEDRCDAIAEAIAEAAWTGKPGDGVVAIEPVHRLIRIRNGKAAVIEQAYARASGQ